MTEPAKLVLASMDGPVPFHPTEHRLRIESIPVRDMYSSADLLRSNVPGPSSWFNTMETRVPTASQRSSHSLVIEIGNRCTRKHEARMT